MKKRCTKCRLHETCRHVLMPGRGSRNPKYMIVGQAPGEREELFNKVFIGPAGQLLLETIKEQGWKDVYLTNTVKCFPPKDRDPKPDEVKACLPYLLREIQILKPKNIIVLGNIAMRALTGKSGIKKLSGERVKSIDLKDGGSSDVYALLHPSYALRYPRDRHLYEMHARAITKATTESDTPSIQPGVSFPYEVLPPVVAKRRMYSTVMDANRLVAFDFETNGKYKMFGGKVRCIGFYSNSFGAVVVDASEPGFDDFMVWFLRSPCGKVAHSMAFEYRWCVEQWGVRPHGCLADTMVLHHIYDENASHRLDVIASQLFKAQGWDISNQMDEEGRDYDTVDSSVLWPYCALDCYWTYRICLELITRLDADPVTATRWKFLYSNIAMPLMVLCARLEARGLKLDTQWAERSLNEVKTDMSCRIDTMLSSKELVGKIDPHSFNPNSPKQLADVLINHLQLKIEEKTSSGRVCLKEAVLEKIKFQHPFVENYLQWKSLSTMSNNYLSKFPKLVSVRGTVHAHFGSCSTVTGRLGVTSPPVQAIPEDKRARGMFISRFNGGKLGYADYKALEMRLVANESNEEVLLDVFKNDLSPHDLTAEKMFGKNYSNRERSIAKRLNFGVVYGVGPRTLMNEFNLSKQEANTYLDFFKRIYPKIFRWMSAQHAHIMKNACITSRFGRVRRLPEIRTASPFERERIFRQAGNFPIQSAGADITNMAAIMLDANLRTKRVRSMLVNCIHDALMVDIYPGEENVVVDTLQQTMSVDIPAVCQDWLQVPLPIDVQVSERWE